MEEKNKTIPLETPEYTLADLSVVIPQAEQYKNRIKWFLEQYCKSTPDEVLNNTWVVYDPDDIETSLEIDRYPVNKTTVGFPQSTYKMQAGFAKVKTRLCVRMHNDCYIARTDWAESLINQFNTDPYLININPDRQSQFIGYVQPSGSLKKESIDKFLSIYPAFQSIYDNLEFSKSEYPTCGMPFMSAHFMASQTYMMRDIYNSFMDFNDGRMDKEDCLFTLFLSFFGVNLVEWNNMGEFVKSVGKHYGDFDEGENPPLVPITVITDKNRNDYEEAKFHPST